MWGAMPRRATLKPTESTGQETKNGRSKYPPDIQRLENGSVPFSQQSRMQKSTPNARTSLTNFGRQGARIFPGGPGTSSQRVGAFEALRRFAQPSCTGLDRSPEGCGSVDPLEAAMDAFLDWRKRSESYTRSIRQTRNRLGFLHGQMLNEITPQTSRARWTE